MDLVIARPKPTVTNPIVKKILELEVVLIEKAFDKRRKNQNTKP